MQLLFDIEGNGLYFDCTQVHCIVAKDIDSGTVYRFRPHQIEKGILLLSKATTLIGHNIINYDLPVLRKLYGFTYTGKVTDTLVMSRLANPDRFGGHSLKSWGKRLGKLKGTFAEDEDETVWDTFSEEMLSYCENDVEVNHLILNAVTDELSDFSELSINIEHSVARIITQQEINGVKFDVDKAKGYIESIEGEVQQLADNIRKVLHLEYSAIGNSVELIFKKNGEYRANVQEWCDRTGFSVGGPFTRIEWDEPNVGSRAKLIKQLLHLGWKPENFTDKGNPKLTIKNEYNETVPCPSLEETLGDLGKDVARFYILRHRQSQIKGWLENVRPDGRITAGANPNGTPTGRMQHRLVANVPRVSSIFGAEMRSLFTVPDGYRMVGADLSGIELRCLAHYMGDKEYIHHLLNGDIHTYNQKKAGLPTRDTAKVFIYGLLYGAGNAKIGKIVGGTAMDGMRLRTAFLDGLPALKKLLNLIDKAIKRGYLKGLDGRKLWIRRDEEGKLKTHTGLNVLLQFAGSITFKIALLYIDKYILQRYDDVKLLISYHDEAQLEVPEHLAEEIAEKMVECMRKAGTFLKFACPIDGEAKIGFNWKDTH